jgi:hypothetical protein
MRSNQSLLVTTLVVTAVLAACGKVSEKISEKASEKAAEKMMESAIESDGSKAKVDLSEGNATITSTDAKGNTTVMEMGNAKVTEAELGIPIYPGATAQPNAANRTKTPDATSVTVGYESKDSPDKVAGFYRERLRAKAEGKQFMDNSSSEGVALMLSDSQAGSSLQIYINKTDEGSSIGIMAMQPAAK